jgi:hypothetical protein
MFRVYTRCLLLIFFSLIISGSLVAQGYKVTGKVLDRTDQSPLVGAVVLITNAQDTTNKHSVLTDRDGMFTITGLSKRLYKLSVTYMGYNKLDQNLIVSFKNQTLENLQLNPRVQQLQQVTIIGNPPPAMLKGDTTEFNAAAFKVTADANVEDLVKKMPGVTIEDGTVKAQGEDVKKVLVDGKPFFGDDPSIALKNLPAELVEKVQVFDQQSEQSQLTGFNDGQTTKTMNIITRSNKRNGQFGKLTASYGDQDRYLVSASMNKFVGAQRFSVIATTNNINQQNFATQDFLGAMGGTSSFGSRSDGGSGGGGRQSSGGSGRQSGGGQSGNRMSSSGSSGNYVGGNQTGINTINSIGLNYNNTFNEHLSVFGSYFFNNNNSLNEQITNTQNILSSDSSRFAYTNTNSNSKNYNNRLNFRVEYLIDTMNTLIIQPSINFQSNKSNSGNIESQSLSYLKNSTPENYSNYINDTKTTGYNISNQLTYRHKFNKTGRTVSLDLNTAFNKREPYNTSNSDVYYYSTNKASQFDSTLVITDRINSTLNNGYTINTNVAYTEPIGKISQLQINVRNSYQKNYSYKRITDLDTITNSYLQIDSLSNKYLNYFITNRLGLSYRIKTLKLNASVGFEVQNSNLSGDQTYPKTAKTDHSFTNVLPNAQMNYRLTQQSNMIINYNTSTNPPSISQLQNVSEYNSNATSVTLGNPNLEPQYTHNITSRFTHVDRVKGSNFFILFGGSINQNSIGNSSRYDTIRTNNTVTTIQVIQPVNKGTGYNLRSFANYGFPIKFIKCNFNISGGYNYNKTPGYVNGKANISTTHTFTESFVFSSNISEKIDFTLATNGSYNIVENTVSTNSNNNYYSQNSSFRFNWIFWKNFTFQNDITNRLYKGLSSSSYNQNVWVVNLGLGKKFMKNNAAELRVSVNDLFNKNTSITRTISGNTITDTQSKILSRYVMASFIYTFRAFKFGAAPEQQERRRRDFDGPPMGGSPMGGPPPGML